MKSPLNELSESKLSQLGKIADRLLYARPRSSLGQRLKTRQVHNGLEFMDYRDYNDGDNPRHIDWRASQRSQHIQTRNYHIEAKSIWLICLDQSASMALENEEKWYLATQLAAAWAYLILRRGDSVGLAGFNQNITAFCSPNYGRSQYGKLLNTIRQMHPNKKNGFSNMSSCEKLIKPHYCLILLSDFFTQEPFFPQLSRLRRNADNVHAQQILHSQEIVPYSGSALYLEDIETGETVELNEATQFEAFEKQFHHYNDKVKQACRDLNIHFSHCTNKQSWHSTIFDHLKNLSRDHA